MTKAGNNVSPVRILAMQLVHDIEEKGLYANLALENALRDSSLEPGDKRLVTGMVNGTIRMIRHLDWVLNLFLNKNIDNQNPWLRAILRMSAYQILFMDRIPDFACINDAVELTRKRLNPALSKVANAVLRNLVRQKEHIEYPNDSPQHYLAVYYSHPDWLVRRYMQLFEPNECENILIYDNMPPALVLRVNTMYITREELIRRMQLEGVTASPGLMHPQSVVIEGLDQSLTSLASFKEGLFYVQNEASMLAGTILAPQPGELVYDFCCGVGGKSTHLAELMQDRGRVEAFDFYEHKIKLAQHNCRRLNLKMVNPQVADILNLSLPLKAERILLDAPCSGLGVLNRRADSRWHKSEAEIESLTQLQLAMLKQAATFLADDGLLLYATCTINPEENQQVVERFLQDDNYELKGFLDKIAFLPLDESDRRSAANGQLTLLPGKYGGDGMFYALLRRKSG